MKTIFPEIRQSRWIPFGGFGPVILYEIHLRKCSCSFCDCLKNNGIGFWFPWNKSKTSWRTFWIATYKNIYYLRWTL